MKLTVDFLKEHDFNENDIQIFNILYPNGAESLNVLHKDLADLIDSVGEEKDLREEYLSFAKSLVKVLPIENPPLIVDKTSNENLIWLGDVHIKGCFSTDKIIFVKGELKIDGRLNVYGKGQVFTCEKDLISHVISLGDQANIRTDTKVRTNGITMHEEASIDSDINVKSSILISNGKITGNIVSKNILMVYGHLFGNISADSLGNYKGRLDGEINVKKIFPLPSDTKFMR